MKRVGSRNKFLTCFLPGFYMEEMMNLDDGFCKLDPSVSDCSVSQSPARCSSCSDEENSVHRIPRRKSFSRSFKTVVSDLFHSQSPRAKDRRSLNNRGSDLEIRVPLLTRMEEEFDYSVRKELDSPSSPSSSSTSTTTSSICSSDSEESAAAGEIRRPDPEAERKRSGYLALFLLMLVSLAVTVVGGKLLGVALTLGCLYLMPRRRGNGGGYSGEGEVKGSLPETEQKKQRMVMGGMLKRGHRRQNLESLIRFRELLSGDLKKSFLL
ncbi:hypothetical protein LINGRAHAP2_LOCUS18802 [Linum grandiflorum]